MMKKGYILILTLFICFSCRNKSNENNKGYFKENVTSSDSSIKGIEEEVYNCVEEYPTFGDSIGDLKKFFRERLVYPQSAIEDSLEGRVFLTFVIEKDGHVSNARAIRGVRYDLDDECIRVAYLMPKWLPGKQDGKPVRVSWVVPITFSLNKVKKEGFANVYPNQKLEKKLEFKIYPNPARDFINIETVEGLSDIEYQIVSMNGNIVCSGKLNSNREQINVSALNNGLYLIKLSSKELKLLKTEKLMIRK